VSPSRHSPSNRGPDDRDDDTGLDTLRAAFVERSGGFLDRFRRIKSDDTIAQPADEPPSRSRGDITPPKPNDLRHYLTQRISGSSDNEIHIPAPGRQEKGEEMPSAPVLKSLDALLEKVLEEAMRGRPRALLIAGTSSKVDATRSAIEIARTLARQNELVILVDLAKGASVVSGPLGMPRVPGFSDLIAGQASFGEVVHVDQETLLQVITAGNPTPPADAPAPDRFIRVFEALTQVYGCVVLHADRAAVDALIPALKFELPVAVAVFPAGARIESGDRMLSSCKALGCPVIMYEEGTRRGALLGRRIAAT
jgi:hypothetical protein